MMPARSGKLKWAPKPVGIHSGFIHSGFVEKPNKEKSMSQDYRPMWENLGLDLQAHDALLGVLGKAYQDIYLSQKNRPGDNGYFDFVMSEVHGLRIQSFWTKKRPAAKSSVLIACSCPRKSSWPPTPPWWGFAPARFRHGRCGKAAAEKHLRPDQVFLWL